MRVLTTVQTTNQCECGNNMFTINEPECDDCGRPFSEEIRTEVRQAVMDWWKETFAFSPEDAFGD